MIKWFEKHNNISLLIAIIIGIFIFYISSIPSSGFPSGLGFSTKIYHVAIFFLLSFALLVSLVQGKKKYKIFVLNSVLIAASYAITDEIHQSLIFGRHMSLFDVLIDTIGILIAGIVYLLILNYSKK